MSNLDKKLNQQEQTNAPVRKIEMSNGGNIPSFLLEKKKIPIKSNLSQSLTDRGLCTVLNPGEVMCVVQYKQLLRNYSCHDQTNLSFRI